MPVIDLPEIKIKGRPSTNTSLAGGIRGNAGIQPFDPTIGPNFAERSVPPPGQEEGSDVFDSLSGIAKSIGKAVKSGISPLGSSQAQILFGQLAQAIMPRGTVAHSVGEVGETLGQGRAYNEYLDSLREDGSAQAPPGLSSELVNQAQVQVQREKQAEIAEERVGLEERRVQTDEAAVQIRGYEFLADEEARAFQQKLEEEKFKKPKAVSLQTRYEGEMAIQGVPLLDAEGNISFYEVGRGPRSELLEKRGLTGSQAATDQRFWHAQAVREVMQSPELQQYGKLVSYTDPQTGEQQVTMQFDDPIKGRDELNRLLDVKLRQFEDTGKLPKGYADTLAKGTPKPRITIK